MLNKDKRMCAGCKNDFYNDHNPYGVKECWSFKDAKVVKRVLIHRDQPPPYLALKLKPVLACWYGESGMRIVDPDSITKDGYWK